MWGGGEQEMQEQIEKLKAQLGEEYGLLELLDLGRAPYALYGVKYIDLVSPAPSILNSSIAPLFYILASPPLFKYYMEEYTILKF